MLSGISSNIENAINNILDFTKVRSVIWSDETTGIAQSDTLEEALGKIPENTICVFWIAANSGYTFTNEIVNDLGSPNRGHMLVYKSPYSDQSSKAYIAYLIYFSVTYNRIYYRVYDNTTGVGFADRPWKHVSLLDT